jgi:hypothetical protein
MSRRFGERSYITHFVRECVHGYAKGPGQAKISELELSFPIDKQVLWFQIAVQDSILVAEGRAHEKLVHEAPNRVWIEGAAVTVCIHVLFEVPFTVLEDKYEFCFGVDDIVEANDVDVLELLHERYLANRGRRSSLFSIKVYLLESDNFICCPGAALGRAGS